MQFIQDFRKIAKPLCKLLVKETSFIFDEECKQAFGALKKILTSTPIIQPPKWGVPFDKLPHVIYYASKTLNHAQLNYSTIEELLAVVFALDMFRSYLLGSKVIIYLDHATLKYIFFQ